MTKFIFGMQVNIEVFPKLILSFWVCATIDTEVFYKVILSFWVCATRHAQTTKKKKFAYLCNISRNSWREKLIFCLQMNTKVFYILIVSVWVCVVKHAQSTQNNILRKNWVMKLIFKACYKLIVWFWWGW